MTNLLGSIFHTKIFIIVCTIAVIYGSGYALSTILPIGVYIDILFAYIFLFPIIAVYIKNKLNMFLSSLILLIIMAVATSFTSGFTTPTFYISYVCKIIFAFGIVLMYDFDDFINVFLKVIVAISLIGLVGYYLLNNWEIISYLPIMNNINSVSYGIGYIFFYIVIAPERNCGIFWEPGLFATFLSIALIFELCFKKGKISIFRSLLFVICIITTKSAAGYGLLIFIALLALMNKANSKINNKFSYLFTFTLFILCVLIVINYSSIIEYIGLSNNEVIYKLMINQMKEQSRFLAINHNLDIFLQRPIFGLGISDAYRYSKYVSDTSTSTFMLSVFGVFGLQYTFYWVYGTLMNKSKNVFINITILIIFTLILNKEPHIGIVFSWCLMFYLLKNAFNKKKFREVINTDRCIIKNSRKKLAKTYI